VTAPGTRPPRSDAPWDISFLRVGALVTAAATAVAAPVAGLIGGWGSAVGVLAGAMVVTAFFFFSGVVIAWAGRIDDAFALPAALGTFLVKLLVLAAVLGSLPEDGWLDRVALAWTVIAEALLWSAVQARWVWTRQLYYVAPPSPRAGPPPPSVATPQVPQPDPERPAPRG
jgi:ATP synthase protein I